MENRTNFDLNKIIKIWKSELSNNSKMTLDNINELESHLREEIHELQLIGLSIEESLLIAKNRIGNVKDLTTEFGKVNKGFYFRNRMTIYLKGILLFMAFITLTDLITGLSIITANEFGLSRNLNNVSIGAILISSLLLIIISYLKYKNTTLNLSKLTSIPILVSLIIVSKLLTFLSSFFMTRSIEISDFGSIALNLSIYKFVFGLFVLIISSTVFYSLRKESKVKIAK